MEALSLNFLNKICNIRGLFVFYQVIIAAVKCSPSVYRLGGVVLGYFLTGKLGRAWVGAWVVHGW